MTPARQPIADAIAAARNAAEGTLRHVANGFRTRTSEHYRAVEFAVPRQETRWTLCTAHMLSSSFNLLDATVHARLEAGTRHAVAILKERPKKDGRGPEPTEDYLRRYQQVAWSAFRVVWVLDSGSHAWEFLADDQVEHLESGDFEAITKEIERVLKARPLQSRPKNSRAAEKVVRDAVSSALSKFSFEAAPSTRYQGFWRRPVTDGRWTRTSGGYPSSFALEVKLDEDVGNPLCQAVEVLGLVDAMVHVRLVKSGSNSVIPAHLPEAKEMLKRSAPMRYIELSTP